MDAQASTNLLLTEIEYAVTDTRRGRWRRYLYPNGQLFAEYVSHARLFGMPVLHYTRGKCPETGKRIVAKGVIAVGRLALGIIAIGQASCGVIALGQASVGVLLCLGQACLGMFAIGQLALATMRGAAPAAVNFFQSFLP